jgi:hypothetical protein
MSAQQRILKETLKSSSTSTSRLQSYILPTLNHQYTLHNRLLNPLNSSEFKLQVSSYILRKWRYTLSDTLAYYWHSFGSHSTSSIWYKLGNRLSTRISADEYFFKSIPQRTTTIQFVYPSSCDLTQIQLQLQSWIQGTSTLIN